MIRAADRALSHKDGLIGREIDDDVSDLGARSVEETGNRHAKAQLLVKLSMQRGDRILAVLYLATRKFPLTRSSFVWRTAACEHEVVVPNCGRDDVNHWSHAWNLQVLDWFRTATPIMKLARPAKTACLECAERFPIDVHESVIPIVVLGYAFLAAAVTFCG